MERIIHCGESLRNQRLQSKDGVLMPRGKSGQYAGDGSSETINVAYASPIVMVMKKDSSNRVCVDFRKLNKITEVDPEPLTIAEDLFHRLPVNLTKGYWQIPVTSEFVTPD